MSSVVQVVRNILTRGYLYYDACTKTAGFHPQQNSESKIRVHVNVSAAWRSLVTIEVVWKFIIITALSYPTY